MEKVDSLTASDIDKAVKIIFTECGPQKKKIISDASTNFMSGKIKQFCRQLHIGQAVTSSYHQLSNGQVEASKICEMYYKNALIIIMMSV